MDNQEPKINTPITIDRVNIFYIFLPLVLMISVAFIFALVFYPIFYDDCTYYCELETRGVSNLISLVILLLPTIPLSILGIHRVNKFVKINGRGLLDALLLIIYFLSFYLNLEIYIFFGKFLYSY